MGRMVLIVPGMVAEMELGFKPPAPLQPLGRQARLDQAHGTQPEVPIWENIPTTAAPKALAGIRSARAKPQQRIVLAGSQLRLGRNQQAIGAKEQDESHDACA